MKTKASWKPVGHSAKKWKEAAQYKGAVESQHAPQPSRKRDSGIKSPWK
jgi:hypothetical protein